MAARAIQAVEGAPVIDRAMPSLDAAGATDRGLLRERNEDTFLVATLKRSILVHDAGPGTVEHGWFTGSSGGTLLAVADGMGGMGSGDVASRAAIRSVADYVLNGMAWDPAFPDQRSQLGSVPGLRDRLATAVAVGDSGVRSEASRPGVSSHLGTTLTLAFVVWPVLYVAHVGDSRCYLARGDALLRLTTDHTVAEEMKERGFASQDVPDGFTNILWNALGGQERTPTPQIQKFALQPADALLLCTDGLNKHVSDAEIAEVLRRAATPADACRELLGKANAGGGTDNTTVIVARGILPSS